MKTLIVNAGSSSLKTALYSDEQIIESTKYDFTKKTISQNQKNIGKIHSLKEAIKHTVEQCKEQEIETIIHRIVHGGPITQTQLIDKNIKEHIKKYSELAPLHNTPALEAIEQLEKFFSVPQIAVFDTAYHQTIPEYAHRYGIPDSLYKQQHIRKYGFHGISHKYLAQEAHRLYGVQKVITCHLGNGSSITANSHCASIDTSMGFTPTDGLIMGTRSGALDPEIILYLLHQMHMSPKKVHEFLNQKSGLLGISHFSGDVRDLRKASIRGKGTTKEHAKLALQMLAYNITKYIGTYNAVLNGAEMIVFSGGIGESAWYLRRDVLKNLDGLGIQLDDKKNKAAIGLNQARVIHKRNSTVKLAVIPTDENIQMIREAKTLL